MTRQKDAGGDGQEEKLLHIKQKVHPHMAVPAPCRTSSSARFKGQRWHQLDCSDGIMDQLHYDVEGGFDETDKGKPWHSSTLTSHIQLQRRNFSLTWTRSNFVPVLQKASLSVPLLPGFRVVVVPGCQVPESRAVSLFQRWQKPTNGIIVQRQHLTEMNSPSRHTALTTWVRV